MSLHPIFEELLGDFAKAPATARKITEAVRAERMEETMREIAAIAHVCVIQRVPSDDKIIADHIEEIEQLAKKALRRIA